MSKKKILHAAIASILLMASGASAAADSALVEAQSHIDHNNPHKAYAILAPLEAERAGNPEYDYLLGIAALDAGEAGRAVFALERVLEAQPDNGPARAAIARAHYALGEIENARTEFRRAGAQPVPPPVQASIQKYLIAIEALENADRPKLSGYVAFSAGHDSNVNSAISGNQLAIPAFGGAIVTLDVNGVKQDDAFLALGGGAKLRYPLNWETAVIGSIDGNRRWNGSASRFDTGILSGSLGLSFARGKNNFSAQLQGQNFELDGNRYRDASGLMAQWEYLPNENRSFSAYVQYARLDYPDQGMRNANHTVLGVTYGQTLGGELAPVIYVGAYAGSENERADNAPYLGHNLAGIRVGGQLNFSPQVTLFASGSYEERDYGGPDPLFLVDRGDQQTDFRVGVNYSPVKAWRITPQLAYTRNNSNIAINDYDRNQFIVTVRREFQ